MVFNLITDFAKEKKISGTVATLFAIAAFSILFLAITYGVWQGEIIRYCQPGTGENSYRLTNHLSPEQVKEVYLKEGLGAFARFQEQLMTPSEEFTYATVRSVPITIARKLEERFLYGYDDGLSSGTMLRSYSSVQLNEGMSLRAGLVPEEGRNFSKEDFQLSENAGVAVLLGKELQQYYSVGDNIPFSYLGIEYSGHVVGILPAASTMRHHQGETLLDRSFILPDLDGGGKIADNMSSFNQNTIYSMGGGYFYSRLSILQMQERVDRMLAAAGLQTGDFCLEGLRPLHWERMGLSVAQTWYLIAAGFLVLYALTVGALAGYTYRKTGRMNRVLAVHLLCGARKKQLIGTLYLASFLQILVVFLFSLCAPVLIGHRILQPWGLILPVLLAAVLIPIPAAVKVSHMEIPDGIGGKPG